MILKQIASFATESSVQHRINLFTGNSARSLFCSYILPLSQMIPITYFLTLNRRLNCKSVNCEHLGALPVSKKSQPHTTLPVPCCLSARNQTAGSSLSIQKSSRLLKRRCSPVVSAPTSYLQTMHAHSQFCMSGDHTLEGTEHAIKDITTEEADEYFVIILSDANLSRYGINPARFAQILTSDPQVNAFAIFIGSLGDQAAR